MTPALRLLFVGLAALGAGVFGYYLYDRAVHRHAARGATPTSTASVATDADALPKPGLVGPTVPAMRPVFTLKDVGGRPRSITEWDGRSLVVNFWATWCAPCRREIPLLNRLHAEYAPQGVEVLGIAVDFAADVAAYVKQFPVGYPVLVGEQDGLDAAEAFGVKTMAFPFTIFVDRRGHVLAVHMGEIHEPEARAILGVVARVNAGALPPGAARGAIQAALDALPKPARAGA